jgi:hypothetical protein
MSGLKAAEIVYMTSETLCTHLEPVREALEKIKWVRDEIQKLEPQYADYLSQSPVSISRTVEREDDNAKITYSMTVEKQPPKNLSYETGNVVHAIRSVIDNLIWATGQEFDCHEKLAFKFFEKPNREWKRYRKSLSCLPAEIIEWIERNQTFAVHVSQTFSPKTVH